MIKAVPINKQGEQIGHAREFTNEHWARLVSNHNKVGSTQLAWREVSVDYKEPVALELMKDDVSTLETLRLKAKELGIRHTSRMKKETLLNRIKELNQYQSNE